MIIQHTFLRSRVARRVFTLFVVSALVPIIALGVLSFTQVHRQISEHSERQLHRETKSIGVAIIERLTVLDTELSFAVDRVADANLSKNPSTAMGLRNPGHGFSRFLLRREDTELVAGERHALPDWLSHSEAAHLMQGKALLKSKVHERAQPELFLLRSVNPGDLDGGVLVVQITAEFLWDVPINSTTNYCVLDERPSHRLIPASSRH